MAQVPTILRPEDMTRLANYRFAVRMMAEGWLSGRHRARGRGSSSDFLEYRAYAPGDDPRLIDWRAFARTDRLQLRTFEHETHLECHLFVDCSASMDFRDRGPVSKLAYACHFAACVAWLVVRGKDRVSLQLFDEQVRDYLPPGSATTHLNRCLSLLENTTAGGRTDLPQALERARGLVRHPVTLVIVSDFLCDIAALQAALNSYLHLGCKVVLVQVLDPGELSLSGQGLARFVDMESGERVTCNPDELRRTYSERMVAMQQLMHAMASARGMLYLPTTTDRSFYPLFDALAK